MAGRNFKFDFERKKIPFSRIANNNNHNNKNSNNDDDDDDDYNDRECRIEIKSYYHGLDALYGAIKDMKKNYQIEKNGESRSRKKNSKTLLTELQPTFMWIDLNNDKTQTFKDNNRDNGGVDHCTDNDDRDDNNQSDDDNDDSDNDNDSDSDDDVENRNRRRNRNRSRRKCDFAKHCDHENGSAEWCESPSASPSLSPSSASLPPPLFPSSLPHPLDVFYSCDRALDELYVLCDPGTFILVLTQADIQPLVQLLSEKQRLDLILTLFFSCLPYFILLLFASFIRR